MYIKFHNTKYELLDNPNISASRFQATIIKGGNSFDSIINDTVDADEIVIIENDEIIGVYNGYTKRIAISIYQDDTISVELDNTDIQAQIDTLTESFLTQQTSIDKINDSLDSITPYTETKTAYYNENEKTFYNVPEGNISVFFDNYNGNYSINRIADRVTVSFDTLTDSTNITISVN